MKHLLIALVLLSALIFIGCDAKPPQAVQSQAPEFNLKDMNGNEFKLSDLIGTKPLVLDFWATWCAACLNELPKIIELDKKHRDQINIVGINLDRTYESAQKYTQDRFIQYSNLFDEGGKVARAYGVVGIPSLIIINSQGQIIKRNATIEDVKALIK